MQTKLDYMTLDGRTLGLQLRSKKHRSFFERCYEVYSTGRSAEDFTRLANLVAGQANPLVAAAGGRITNAVWEHPLFQAVRDLEDRLGICVGELEAVPGDENAPKPSGDLQPGDADAPPSWHGGELATRIDEPQRSR